MDNTAHSSQDYCHCPPTCGRIQETDKDGNIINDNNNGDQDDTLEITEVDTINGNDDTHNTEDKTLEIIGVSNDAAENMEETEAVTETEICNNEHNISSNMDSKLNEAGHKQDRDY